MSPQIVKLLYDLTELSDPGLQRKRWLGMEAPDSSSYSELMSRLFEDNELEEFVNHPDPSSRISPQTLKGLIALKNNLELYPEKETDEEILNDPAWRQITVQASKVLRSWEMDMGS